MDFARWLHMLGVTVWVGGMFFAYMALRPVAATVLPPPLRLPLWRGTFARFFPWVWVSIVLILSTGLHMTMRLGGSHAPPYVLAMAGIGVVMMLIFAHIFFSPYRRLGRYVDAQDWPAAGAALAQIRRLVGLNLILGLVTVTVATAGRGVIV
ncbi:MAG: CopD family protein [Burkholderiales bacterium]|nr:CopD family protein [Burkholderiales bacterium]